MKACVCLMAISTAVFAAPMLRLQNSVVTVHAAVGAQPFLETLGVTNAGDGTLALTVSVPPQNWLSAAYVDASHFIQFFFSTRNLAAGTYSARVTVSDPNAVDSPQVVIVTLQVGFPPIDRYVAPGTEVSLDVPGVSGYCNPCVNMTATTNDGGGWLKVGINAAGTLLYEWPIGLVPAAGMAAGTYTGNVTVGPPINSNIPVTMRLTTQPIAVPSAGQINLQLAQNGPPMTYPFLPFISLSNSGMGTLQVTGVSASGTGVSAYNYNGLAIVTVESRVACARDLFRRRGDDSVQRGELSGANTGDAGGRPGWAADCELSGRVG
jgi:hypothetical protein